MVFLITIYTVKCGEFKYIYHTYTYWEWQIYNFNISFISKTQEKQMLERIRETKVLKNIYIYIVKN